MTIRLVPLALLAIVATACSPGADESEAGPGPEPLTAAHVSNLIAADGAAHTLAVLTGPADPSAFDQVTTGIATGDAAWLAVAQDFRPHADGWPAEGLSAALATAIPVNAAGVLAVLDATGGASELSCDPGPDAQVTAAAVRAVTDPSLAEIKRECLGYVTAASGG